MTLFLVHSLYHIFYALSIAERNNLTNVVIICATSNGDKFIKIFDSIRIKYPYKIMNIKHNDTASKLSDVDLETLDLFKKQTINELIIFNQDNMMAVYLGKFFHRKNCKVSLAQDGLKAYAPIKRNALKYKFERSIMYYNFIKSNGFEYSRFFVNLKYASYSFIDNLYLSHPHACLESNKSKIEVNLSSIILDKFSDLLFNNKIDFNKETIFFASSLLKFNVMQIEIEIKILTKLANQFNCYQKILKVHPRVSNKVYNELQKIEGWIIIKDNFPGELLINSLKSTALVFSGYSSIALFKPRKELGTIYYWLYPLYGTSIKALSWLQINKPSEDIILINSFNQLVELRKSIK
ncbi:hypothetical protein P872_09245 [Rhodonellum psychrophilum GCM71 = DSM 17998]|uniref:Uncharacterized protein n=2 Tax=Rhodonellum TaxID=336827 RepID=U5BM16_9BACT|nr:MULTISPECIES: hypothetical protein [Rhodonellum]ERM81530.1 hypothetical protein P872_09245 [Rhodonellum psychrophilum GCM71 = DSM 17998]SDZ40642.1 hypothetical protein SAMN05444412_11348 [Rhodonellum ikkaensis]